MRVLFERLAGLENRMALAGSHNRGVPFPLVPDFGTPRQIAQAGVTIFVELRVLNFLVHAPKLCNAFSFRGIFRVAYGELLQYTLFTRGNARSRALLRAVSPTASDGPGNNEIAPFFVRRDFHLSSFHRWFTRGHRVTFIPDPDSTRRRRCSYGGSQR